MSMKRLIALSSCAFLVGCVPVLVNRNPNYTIVAVHPTQGDRVLLNDDRGHFLECSTKTKACSPVSEGKKFTSVRYACDGGFVATLARKEKSIQHGPPQFVYIPNPSSSEQNPSGQCGIAPVAAMPVSAPARGQPEQPSPPIEPTPNPSI